MATIRFFHEIYGNVHELPDNGSFPYERGLQEFFEKHLRTLTGVEFLVSEYSTGQRHGRRIDTLGIDGAGRPVVIEYKRRRDENVINQGLDYLAWLEDHRAEFRELVREKLGDGRVTSIDFGTPRLLCIAGEFPRQDRIAAESSRRRIELLRYRRYGDAFLAVEWLFGGEAVEPDPPVDHGDEPDYSIYKPWAKTSEETRTLFREFKTLVESFGSVRTVAFRTVMTFKYMVTPGDSKKKPVVAYVHLRRDGLRVHIHEKHLRDIPLEDGFTRPHQGPYREITIRDRETCRRAEPLVRAAYDNLSGSRQRVEPPRSKAARKRGRPASQGATGAR